jgi:hypothetical protein
MTIKTEANNPDNLICTCGNDPTQEGFYPCDSEGEIVNPSPKEWTSNCYVCDRCGRIIHSESLKVVGVRFENRLSEEERQAIFNQI